MQIELATEHENDLLVQAADVYPPTHGVLWSRLTKKVFEGVLGKVVLLECLAIVDDLDAAFVSGVCPGCPPRGRGLGLWVDTWLGARLPVLAFDSLDSVRA